MNTDDLRHVLADDSARQPEVSPDFTAGVQRRVRRRRVQTAVVLTPLVALVVVGVAIARPGPAPDATLATADGGAAGTTVPGTAPATTSTTAAPVTVPGPGEPPATLPDAPTVPDPAPAPSAGGDCGTVTVDESLATSRTTPDLGPLTCFVTAFNARQAASVTVVTTLAGSGSTTSRIATTADHVLTVSADGTTTMKLPPFSLGGEGGVVSGDAGALQDCGTLTVSKATAEGASDPTKAFGGAAGSCLVQALLQGSPARLTTVVEGDLGGAITSAIEVTADHTVTVTTSGTVTVQAPAELRVPEDVLSAIPAAGTSLSGLPGLGGLGTGGTSGLGRK
jgi:hypothetical protein